MADRIESGNDIELAGKSGASYSGKIYHDKNSTTTLPPKAIVCLSNSDIVDGRWQHQIRDIYNTHDVNHALAHFRERDDISHLILISPQEEETGMDRIDDLRRNYIHK